MGLMDWLRGGSDSKVTYTQSPEQQQIYQAILPLLQRLGVSGMGSAGPNQYLTRYNQGQNPITSQALNVRRYNLPSRPQPYQRSATGSNTTQLLALANINKKRVEQGLSPITMDQMRMSQTRRV